MRDVKVGIVGLGNVGTGALTILTENAEAIAEKLGFHLQVAAVCSRGVQDKDLSFLPNWVLKTADWREVVAHPEVEIVAELVGGTGAAREVIWEALRRQKSVVTANKELMAQEGVDILSEAMLHGNNVAMEASVAGGIPIHTVLREGIAGDRVTALLGILNGTCNYILTEVERNGSPLADVLAEAQRLGYAEADPTADVEGYDARSKLAILSALAFGHEIAPQAIYTEGITRISPMDFAYAHQLGHTIRLVCSAREEGKGLLLSVRPTVLPQGTILASVQGAYNAIWVRGKFGQDTFYYGRGAGPQPTGVAVVSDLMRVAREIRYGSPSRVSPYAHAQLGEHVPIPIEKHTSGYFLRFRVKDQPGIIATLANTLSQHHISIEAILQLPHNDPNNLPFVITVEPTTEGAIRSAIDEMRAQPFLVEAPLALPIELGL